MNTASRTRAQTAYRLYRSALQDCGALPPAERYAAAARLCVVADHLLGKPTRTLDPNGGPWHNSHLRWIEAAQFSIAARLREQAVVRVEGGSRDEAASIERMLRSSQGQSTAVRRAARTNARRMALAMQAAGEAWKYQEALDLARILSAHLQPRPSTQGDDEDTRLRVRHGLDWLALRIEQSAPLLLPEDSAKWAAEAERWLAAPTDKRKNNA